MQNGLPVAGRNKEHKRLFFTSLHSLGPGGLASPEPAPLLQGFVGKRESKGAVKKTWFPAVWRKNIALLSLSLSLSISSSLCLCMHVCMALCLFIAVALNLGLAHLSTVPTTGITGQVVVTLLCASRSAGSATLLSQPARPTPVSLFLDLQITSPLWPRLPEPRPTSPRGEPCTQRCERRLLSSELSSLRAPSTGRVRPRPRCWSHRLLRHLHRGSSDLLSFDPHFHT